jgi:hypothetical protein
VELVNLGTSRSRSSRLSPQILDESVQRSGDEADLSFMFFVARAVYVLQSLRCVKTVSHFGQGRPRGLQEMHSLSNMPSAKSLHNIGRHRVRCAPHLRRQSVTLLRREAIFRQFMHIDVEIIRSLPSNETVVG